MRPTSLIARRKMPPAPSRIIRILLVEDCKSDVFLLEHMLEEVAINCFYEIIDVPRLVDAFYKLDQEKFNMVMLDLNLIDIDGIASVAALHAQAPLMPIIVYSGTDDGKTKEKAMMCGAASYLVKGKESGFGIKCIIEQIIDRAMT